MSLTSQLARPDSPVSQFMRAQLPGTTMVKAYNEAAQKLPPTLLPWAPTGQRIDYPILGTAIDIRIRVWLGEQHHDTPRRGTAVLTAPARYDASTPHHERHQPALRAAAAGRAMLDELALTAQAPRLSTAQEERCGRLCLLAARYETLYRAPTYQALQAARRYLTEPCLTEDPQASLNCLLAEIPAYQVADIQGQLDGARTALASLRHCAVTCGPTFAGSPDVGHADADFIAGGTLIDCKATINPKPKPHETVRWMHQLAGYLLLDYDDTYTITHLGIYLSRQSTLITWSAGEFLRLMGTTRSLDVLRLHLQTTLNP